MTKTAKATIEVQGATITVVPHEGEDFISLTDIARYKNPDHPDDVVRNWLRNRSTVEFLGIWERLNNPTFNPVEFDGIRMQTGINSFVLTPKQWVEKTGAVGIRSSAGRYGGTYAHKDIAFEFASWVSVEFRLYLIGVPAPEGGREPAPLARLEPEPRAIQDQLPHPHRCDQGAPDPAGGHACAGCHHLRQRSRPAERGPVRPHRKAMARCQPRA